MARCPVCSAIVPVGSNCITEDGTSFTWTGTGEDGDPYVIEPVLSADPDQLLLCNADGLFAEVPGIISEPPTVQAYRSSHQSVPDNTMTSLTFNIELWDTDSMHSIVANTERITFTTAGIYCVTLNCAWNKDVIGDRVSQIRKNGTDILAYESKDSGGADLIVGHHITLFDEFNATDYIEARVQQTSGSSLLLMGESYSPIFTACRVAPVVP